MYDLPTISHLNNATLAAIRKENERKAAEKKQAESKAK